VFHPAQYQNLVWLLWYGASVGADNAPLEQQPDTYAQPIPGTSGVRRAIQQRAQLAGRSIALRQFGAGDQAAAPEEPTWAQPTSGTRAIRLAAAARARALSAARSQIWTTAQDADAPLPTQESTWTQQVPGTRALSASTRLAWRVAATRAARGHQAFEPLQPPPEESTWPQPVSGTRMLGAAAAARATRAARATTTYLRATAQDLDGPLSAQESTWTQPIAGTRAIERHRRTAWGKVAATQAPRAARADEASAGDESTWAPPVSGTRALELARSTLQLRASRTIALRSAPAGDLLEAPPVPAPVQRALATPRRAALRAATTLLWSAPSDREQEPLTPWTQAVVGVGALERTARAQRGRSVMTLRHRLAESVFTEAVSIIRVADDRLVAPVRVDDEGLVPPVAFDDESWVP
jgi:hypothetical protein